MVEADLNILEKALRAGFEVVDQDLVDLLDVVVVDLRRALILVVQVDFNVLVLPLDNDVDLFRMKGVGDSDGKRKRLLARFETIEYDLFFHFALQEGIA